MIVLWSEVRYPRLTPSRKVSGGPEEDGRGSEAVDRRTGP